MPLLPCSCHHEAIPEAPGSYCIGFVRLGSGIGVLHKEWRVRRVNARRRGNCEFHLRLYNRVNASLISRRAAGGRQPSYTVFHLCSSPLSPLCPHPQCVGSLYPFGKFLVLRAKRLGFVRNVWEVNARCWIAVVLRVLLFLLSCQEVSAKACPPVLHSP